MSHGKLELKPDKTKLTEFGCRMNEGTMRVPTINFFTCASFCWD